MLSKENDKSVLWGTFYNVFKHIALRVFFMFCLLSKLRWSKFSHIILLLIYGTFALILVHVALLVNILLRLVIYSVWPNMFNRINLITKVISMRGYSHTKNIESEYEELLF